MRMDTLSAPPRRSVFVLVAMLAVPILAFAVPPYPPREQLPKDTWYKFFRGELLCKWKETEPYPKDAPELPFCTEDTQYIPSVLVEDDVVAWFNHWKTVDPAAGAAAAARFNAALEAAAKPIEDEIERKKKLELEKYQAEERERKRASAVAAKKREDALAAQAISLTDIELCEHVYRRKSEVAKAELKRRNAFSAEDWRLIDKQNIRVGMKEAGLICAFGPSRVNRTVRANFVHKQYVYGDVYVYVENGVITAFQD